MSETMKRKFWHCGTSPKGASVLKALDNADDCIVIGSYDHDGGCEVMKTTHHTVVSNLGALFDAGLLRLPEGK